MPVDKAELSESQARALAQKRSAVQLEENALEIERGRSERARLREMAAEKEKTDKQIVEISKAAEYQVEASKKMNMERVRSLNENSEKSYTAIASTTAEKIKALEDQATKAIEGHTASSMERLKYVMSQSEDPFYRVKTLSPVMGENEKEYTIKLHLPDYEAQNVFASGEGDRVKISLSRRYNENVKNPEAGQTTKTSSYQTVVEQIDIPGAYEHKKIYKDYTDGILTVHVPKKMPEPKV